ACPGGELVAQVLELCSEPAGGGFHPISRPVWIYADIAGQIVHVGLGRHPLNRFPYLVRDGAHRVLEVLAVLAEALEAFLIFTHELMMTREGYESPDRSLTSACSLVTDASELMISSASRAPSAARSGVA